MASVDLLFEFPAPAGPDLLFGDVSPPARGDVTLVATLPALSCSISVIPNVAATIAATFPALELALELQYASHTDRPLASATTSAHQGGQVCHGSAQAQHQLGQPALAAGGADWAPAVGGQPSVASLLPGRLQATRIASSTPHQVAAPVPAGDVTAGHADAERSARALRASRFGVAGRLNQDALRLPHQDGLHDRRQALSVPTAGAAQLRSVTLSQYLRSGAPLRASRLARHQLAIVPGAGSIAVVTPPTGQRCYTPSGNLVFSVAADGSANLLFVCEAAEVTPEPPVNTIIIPVRRAYIVVNETSLVRAIGNVPIDATDLNVSFDADSWVASFSASIPESARDAIMPDPSPVEIIASINGTAFHFLVEKVSRNRSFGKRTVTVAGRGIACELDSPYAPVVQHTNPGDRTAQQLIADALQFTGYDLDWNITDWLVPAGVMSLSGTPIAVAQHVAEAAGAVLAADWSQRTLRLLPRYPVKPWLWATATPEYVIPGAVTQTEAIEWVEYPGYNAVFVSGVQAGVLGHVKIAGTAGDVIAPMVTHPLITHADAARQRGSAILGNTGRKARMQISLPMLPESGIIDVCQLVEFSDGANTRRGIVRGNSIQDKRPVVRQTLTIEATA